jgi:CRP-like cAMP-binding protein
MKQPTSLAEGAAGENRLLAALPQRSRQRLLTSCEQVELRFADVVCELGDEICHVYFPTDSVISLVTVLDCNARLELGMVGDEGMLGTSLTLGVSHSPQHAVVHSPGAALRMNAANFGRHYREDGELRRLLSRYVYVVMRQFAQTAACARYHLVEARLARWLLMSRDRAHRTEFHLTHAFLAYVLGVRRAGVTQAASSLQAKTLIRYSRGALTILDDGGLEKASCACYREGNAMYAQTLGSPRAAGRR